MNGNGTIVSYQYRGRYGDGHLEDGTMSADSADTVADHLLAKGITPIDIVPKRERATPMAWFSARGRVRPQQLSILCRQLYTMLQAGVPINSALSEVATTLRHGRLTVSLRSATEMIENGFRLSDALAEFPDMFTPLFINMVRAGEETGTLDEVFLNLSQHLEREHLSREKLTSALRYPILLIVMALAAIMVVTIFVVPVFAGMIESSGGEMPLPTRILMAISHFFQNSALWIAGGGMTLALLFRLHRATPSGRLFWDRLWLRVPGFGPLVQMGVLGRFARSLSLVTNAGMPLLQGLPLVAGTIDNSHIRSRIDQLRDEIGEGQSFIRSAERAGIFSPMLLQVVKVGEQTGEIGGLLGHVAEYYERELNNALENINALIEPLLLILISGLVLVLGLGAFLPYLETFKSALL